MRSLPLEAIGNMPELRREVVEVFPCFLWPQSNNGRYAEPDKEEDDTESELHIENDYDTNTAESTREDFIRGSMLVHTRYNDEYRYCQACHFLWWFRQTKILMS